MGVVIEHREDLRLIVKGLQSQGKCVVFTNGVFDLLHVGHIRSLIDARSRGDFLVVAINSDASVRKLKDPKLPVIPWIERAEVLTALECVDYVTVIEEETADDLLAYLTPNLHAKGTDYTPENVPERETVLGYGGEIAIVGDPKKHSTTNILGRVAEIFTGKKKAEAIKCITRERKAGNSKKSTRKTVAEEAKTNNKKTTKTVIKKISAKKTVAKKTVAKKTAAKKTAAKKTTAKKTVAKKTTTKKKAVKKPATRAKATPKKKAAATKKKQAKKSAAPAAKKKATKKSSGKKPAAKAKQDAKKKVKKSGKSKEMGAF